ncbi:MAG TPA: phenylalanine--tRNA ligase beta subunit-related protein, partial [Thermomicrobiales bacterium]|nr:phenylalanine--tRNA ligase beta subunit-related protein [Thermomicrobiales bacterium]
MIVSWNWLKQYVELDMPVAELERRLMMAGLNHESTDDVGGDLAIDLEVTSNRPDCLGHLGVAREVAVLWGRSLKLPAAAPREGDVKIGRLARVSLECPALCYRYTARVIRGVKIGPSPSWLVRRLATVGIAAINNVVDITNYVLLECGQPLHAFDLAKLAGAEIVVREGRPGEKLLAI